MMAKTKFAGLAVIVFLALFFICSNALARGGDLLWDDGVTVTAVDNVQSLPQIASDGYGGSIIAWVDNRDYNDYDIYAQKVDATGTVRWTTNGVAISTETGYKQSVQIISDGCGGAVITWVDFRGGTSKIFAQRISRYGEALWTENGIVVRETGGGGELSPQLALAYCDAPNEDIQIMFTWQTGTYPATDIWAQMLDENGDPASGWSDTGIPVCFEPQYQQSPQIVADGEGGAIITWKDGRNGLNYYIFARRIDADSSIHTGWEGPYNDGIRICSDSSANQIDPQLVADGDGGALIAWEDSRSGNQDIYVQKINADATIDGSAIAVCTESGDQDDLQIAEDGNGGAIICWRDQRGGTYTDIYAQRIEEDGTASWGSNGNVICTNTGNSNYSPQIAADGANGALLTWYNSDSIYAQRVDEYGEIQWSENGVEVSTASNPPQLVTDDTHGAIITYHSGSYPDIYVQRVEGIRNWYFAEGHCSDNFYTWILLQNPGEREAECLVTLMKEDGTTINVDDGDGDGTVNVPAESRYTINANNYVSGSFSTSVVSVNGVGVMAERSMYWDFNDISYVDGHCTIGITQPHTNWYLAEGSTGGPLSFDTFILIQNPSDYEAQVVVTLMKPDGSTIIADDDGGNDDMITIAANSRRTIDASQFLDDESFSTKVESINGIFLVAERAMYWNSDRISWIAGHCSIGVNESSLTWYSAEGCTAGYDEYILIMNPNLIPTRCSVTFMKEDGDTWSIFPEIPATGRYTVHVNTLYDETLYEAGDADIEYLLDNTSLSTQVISMGHVDENGNTISTETLPVIVERSMYWDTGVYTWGGGHCSVGVTRTAADWLLPEGCTNGFDQWVLIQNPSNINAECTVTFMKEDGSTVSQVVTIDPLSRYTIHANSIVPSESISTRVESTNGVNVIVERAMYWDNGETSYAGGHCSRGVIY